MAALLAIAPMAHAQRAVDERIELALGELVDGSGAEHLARSWPANASVTEVADLGYSIGAARLAGEIPEPRATLLLGLGLVGLGVAGSRREGLGA